MWYTHVDIPLIFYFRASCSLARRSALSVLGLLPIFVRWFIVVSSGIGSGSQPMLQVLLSILLAFSIFQDLIVVYWHFSVLCISIDIPSLSWYTFFIIRNSPLLKELIFIPSSLIIASFIILGLALSASVWLHLHATDLSIFEVIVLSIQGDTWTHASCPPYDSISAWMLTHPSHYLFTDVQLPLAAGWLPTLAL